MARALSYTRWLKLLSFILISCCLLTVQSLVPLRDAWASEREKKYFYSMGWATVKDDNYAAAKRQAVSRALGKGVEDYIISELGAELVSQNLERVTRELLPKANELVENFHILGESKSRDKYFVIVKLRINRELAEKRLEQAGLLEQQGPLIKTLFMVLEDLDGRVSCWWQKPSASSSLSPTELALISTFQKAGLQPINRTLQLPDTEFSPYLRAPYLTDSALAKWGELFGAHLVIHGRAQLYKGQEALLSLKVFSVEAGGTICDGSQAGFLDPDMDPERMVGFLEELAERVLTTLWPCIEENVNLQGGRLHTIEVSLRGIKNYMDYRRFLDFLNKEIRGVEKVRQSRIGSGYVSLKVDFMGSVKAFIQEVMTHEALPVEVQRVEEGEDSVAFYLTP